MQAHRGRHDERMELPGRSHDDLANDLRDLRIVRCPHRATKRGHIAVGKKNVWSSQGAAATMTLR
jgi:hypothetical protein